MKRQILVVFGIIVLSSAVYYAYWPWLRPKEYIVRMTKTRDKVSKNYPFLPQNLGYIFFSRYPKIDVFWARFASLLAILISILFIVGAIWSPYLE